MKFGSEEYIIPVFLLLLLLLLDKNGLLESRLTREGDSIHLGTRGIAELVRCIKFCVYTRWLGEKRRECEINHQRPPTSTHDPQGPAC